jgi:hypothetical protein
MIELGVMEKCRDGSHMGRLQIPLLADGFVKHNGGPARPPHAFCSRRSRARILDCLFAVAFDL